MIQMVQISKSNTNLSPLQKYYWRCINGYESNIKFDNEIEIKRQILNSAE